MTPLEKEVYESYVVLREFNIKPWELEGYNSPRYEDIQAILYMKRLERESEEREAKREQMKQGLKERAMKAGAFSQQPQ